MGAVPEDLARLWRLQPTGRLGRPAELDVDQVVGTAVRLADRGGLPGATLPKVAGELGYSTMALYRYIGSKDELLTLMVDHAIGPPPTITVAPRQWRAGLREWSRVQQAIWSDHPWLRDIPAKQPPSGPNQIGWLDSGLQILRGLALGWREKVGIVTLISGYVRQTAQLSTEHQDSLGPDPTQAYRDYGRALSTLVDPGRFPQAAALFASDEFERPRYESDPINEFHFEFGLELILSGIAAQAAKPSPGG